MWLQKKYALSLKTNRRDGAVYTVLKKNDDLPNALPMHAPRGTRRSDLSGAPRYLPSVVVIKSRSRHANRPTYLMWYETPDCSLVDKRPVREVISICWRAPCDKTKYGFIMPGMLMSDQRWRSCCTLADGKHNNNTSNKKTGLKNSSRNANTNANTLIIGHSYASLFYPRNMDIYFRGFLCRECFWMINVEGYAAHCRMASTTISKRVMKRQDRRTQHKMRICTW